jgi:hypothetical protein
MLGALWYFPHRHRVFFSVNPAQRVWKRFRAAGDPRYPPGKMVLPYMEQWRSCFTGSWGLVTLIIVRRLFGFRQIGWGVFMSDLSDDQKELMTMGAEAAFQTVRRTDTEIVWWSVRTNWWLLGRWPQIPASNPATQPP